MSDPTRQAVEPCWSRTSEVFPQHVPPIRPIVSALGAPVVEMVRNAAGGENPREAVRFLRVLPRSGARRQVDVATRQMVPRPAVGDVRGVVDGVVEVEVVVVLA